MALLIDSAKRKSVGYITRWKSAHEFRP